MDTTTLGVCSWSLQPKDKGELLAAMKKIGFGKVQLALSPLVEEKAAWESVFGELKGEGYEVVSGMYSPLGEDYSTLETIKMTGGLAMDEVWEANQEMAKAVAEVANKNDLKVITFHAGFIPHDSSDPMFRKLCDRIVTVADIFKDAGCETLFETGQETADDLMAFLKVLGREDVGINFDPANMILYGKGDPIESLRKLISKVCQVHIKDATATKEPGTWGAEVCVGAGEVDWNVFVKVLKDHGYDGHYVVEREAGDQRIADIKTAGELIADLL
ncbi:sugar phosphate isomerase/epimerase [Planctomycetota bacterium]|nr:sugar phosphate isomerase/epimerase [Planctomycetota bacterium]